jgi:[acyl-carrier-protein] S-malonyltransferase
VLFVHSYAAMETMLSLYPEKRTEIVFDLSLEELSALCIAEVFDFETGLKIAHKRGTLMQKAFENMCGTMASLIGGMFDDIFEFCDKIDVEIANMNYSKQFVISSEYNDM